ncbi:MAG: hypothetical protein AB1551_07920 [Actinomycetota bacterium]
MPARKEFVMRRFWFLVVLVADLALVATLTAVPFAQAAFPGENGKVRSSGLPVGALRSTQSTPTAAARCG